VGGAAWVGRDLIGPHEDAALAKLHWLPDADDLPMHIHPLSDRFIVVLRGRGYFHYSEESLADFDGSSVQTIAARERDVFAFTRGTVHTFSTAESDLVLLSCQLPYLPFDHPKQYRLPAHQWTARSASFDRAQISFGRWSRLV
jgi:quercetin dioxygenase-like cupin family protein